MNYQALFILTGHDNRDWSALDQRIRSGGLDLTRARGADEGLKILKSWAASGYPPRLVLIGPDTEQALSVARNLHRIAPGTHVVFAVESLQQEAAQQRVAQTSIGNGDWSVVDIDSEDIARRLLDISHPGHTHHPLDETLDKLNRQLSQHRASKPSEHRKLLASEKYLNTLLSVTPNAVIAVTPQADIVSWNQAAVTLFGLSEEEAFRRKVVDLAGDPWPREIDQLVHSCFKTGQRKHLEFECNINDTPVYLETWMLPIEHSGETPELVSVIVRDISDTKQQEYALKRANEELERSNMELQQFAYIASHDLQSPLRSISGFLQLLQTKYRDKLGEEADEWIGHTISNVEKLKTLIGDLLRYSRVESRARPFSDVNFNDVFDSVTVMLGASIRDSRATVTRDDLPVVPGDSSQLCQVLLNLVSNAIKYQGVQPPCVHVSAERDGDNWRFSVRDNGLGIEERHGERIFEIFRRLHTDRTHPGTGIGLAVCRRVILRHGGRIWVESDGSNGSTFCFTLPATTEQNHE